VGPASTSTLALTNAGGRVNWLRATAEHPFLHHPFPAAEDYHPPAGESGA
jgi:hypothetical protein